MRILYYLSPNEDPRIVRAMLLAQGWKQVAFRSGWLWNSDCRIDTNWPAVCAPRYPGIARLYEAAGIKIVNADLDQSHMPAAPVELVKLPPSDIVTVLCPGEFLRHELAAHAPQGVVIGVNEAARIAACNWQLCNDGFSDAKFLGVIGSPNYATRGKFSNTVSTGTWFDLSRIGITDGSWSVLCALRMGEVMKPKTIYLMGHDLTVGNGVDGMTGHWPSSQLASVRMETDLEIKRLRSAGVVVVHVRWIDGQAVADGAPAVESTPASEPVKPVKRGARRAGPT